MNDHKAYPMEGQTGPYPPQPGLAYTPTPYAQPAVTDASRYSNGTFLQSEPPSIYIAPAPLHVALEHRYAKGCCGCHVKTCVLIIGILESIGLAISLICGIVFYTQYSMYYYFYSDMIACIVSAVIGAIILACLFYGVCRERSGWLLPHIVYQMFGIAGLIIGAVTTILGATNFWINDGYNARIYADGSVLTAEIIVVVIFGIAAIIEILFMWQVLKCYRYFKLMHHGVRRW